MIMRMKIGNNAVDYMPVAVSPKDRFKPTFVAGATGSGKSEWLLSVFYNDGLSKVARIFIDPLGTLAPRLWSTTRGKAKYLSMEHPLALNPMVLSYKPSQIVDIIIETLNLTTTSTTANERLTSKMISILSDAIIFCIKHERLNLQHVKDFIARDSADHQTRDGIISRLNLLLKDEDFHKIVCSNNSLDIGKIIENQETLILDCQGMGAMKMTFVGALLVKMIQAHFNYTRIKDRKPVILYMDECHNFLDRSFGMILKEGRNFNFSCILATQDFAFLKQEITHVILSNSGTLILLRAGHIEGNMISSEFRLINGEDAKILPKYYAFVKTPDGEYAVKLPRPIYVKELKLPTMKQEKRTFDLKWFDIDPSYCFQLDYEPDGAVAGNGL